MSKVTKELAEQAIKTICKAATLNIAVTNEIEEGLTLQLEHTATALLEHYGADAALMDEYRSGIEEAENAETADEILFSDAEEARDTVYQMCLELTDPKEIMRHVFAMREMLYLCEPNGYPKRRKRK